VGKPTLLKIKTIKYLNNKIKITYFFQKSKEKVVSVGVREKDFIRLILNFLFGDSDH
jgi:hypothetical protein